MLVCNDYFRLSYPDENGEEREGDGGSCRVWSLLQRQFFRWGVTPLIGQEAKSNKPEESPKSCEGMMGNYVSKCLDTKK